MPPSKGAILLEQLKSLAKCVVFIDMCNMYVAEKGYASARTWRISLIGRAARIHRITLSLAWIL